MYQSYGVPDLLWNPNSSSLCVILLCTMCHPSVYQSYGVPDLLCNPNSSSLCAILMCTNPMVSQTYCVTLTHHLSVYLSHGVQDFLCNPNPQSGCGSKWANPVPWHLTDLPSLTRPWDLSQTRLIAVCTRRAQRALSLWLQSCGVAVHSLGTFDWVYCSHWAIVTYWAHIGISTCNNNKKNLLYQ